MKDKALKIVVISLIFLAILSCSWEALIKPNGDYSNPQPIDSTSTPIDTTVNDTTIDTVSLPLVFTCDTLYHLSDTAFVCLSAVFDNTLVLPLYSNIYDHHSLVYFNLIELLQNYWPQYKYTIYQSTNAICVYVDGTDNSSIFQAVIKVTDINNTGTSFTAFKLYHAGRGALTFEQECYEADHRLNETGFDFWHTNFTPEQYNIIARKRGHFQDCKAGEAIFDCKNAIGIDTMITDSAKNVFHWVRVKKP